MFLYSSSTKHSQILVPKSKMSQNNTTKASEPRFSKHELHHNQYSLPSQSQKNSTTSSISDKYYKHSQNCELWKITRQHTKKIPKLILIICSHTVSSSTCSLNKNYSKIVMYSFMWRQTSTTEILNSSCATSQFSHSEAQRPAEKLELSE